MNEVSTPQQMSLNSIERVLYGSFRRPEEGRNLSLSWEGIMIGRRLILVVMNTFVIDPMPRLVIMSVLCFLFLLHHSSTQPFRDSIANTAETISLLFIVVLANVNVFSASFLSLAVPHEDVLSSWWKVFEWVEITILCFAPVVFGLLVVIAMLSQLCRLTFVVCRLLRKLWLVCCRSHCSNRDSENRPLLDPVRS